MKKNVIQEKNLPAEFLAQPRFFAVGSDKQPHVTAWQKPENQKLIGDVDSAFKGFDTCGHGLRDDYLFLDLDHVLTDTGEFVTDTAKQCFDNLCAEFGACYVEKSISGHGLHIFARPLSGKFPAISAGRNGTLKFDARDAKDAPKLEIFYKSKGRYCLVTGNLFNCPPNSPIPNGEPADKVFADLLAQIAAQNSNSAQAPRQPQQGTKHAQAPRQPQQGTKHEDSPEYDLFRARIMLDVIDPAALTDEDWLAVISAAKNIGVPYSDVDAFNRRDADRYNASENQTRWDSVTDSSFGIQTLHGIAKRFGYEEKAAREKWLELQGDLPKQAGEAGLVGTGNRIIRKPPKKPIPPDKLLTFEQRKFLCSNGNSDLDNARRVEYLHGDKIRYLTDADKWLIWQPTGIWKDAGEKNSAVMPFVQNLSDTLRLNGQGDSDFDKTLRGTGLYLANAKNANPCIAMMKGLSSLRITQKDLNSHGFLFCVQNGVVDLTNGKLYDADHKLLLTQQAPCIFRKDAHSTVVDKFLADVLPDDSTRDAVLRFLGYCLTADVRHHKALFMKGPGGNGKGTFTRLLKRVFGLLYSCDVSAEAFLIGKPKDSSAPNPEFYNLRGRRLAFVEELPRNRQFDVPTLKKMTGGDRVTARALHQNFLDGGGFDPTHKLLFSGNHMPHVADVSEKGFQRRLLCVPFDVDFTDNPDETLDDKLATPDALSAMLSKLVDAAVDWHDSGKLIETALMARAKSKYIADNDFVNDFVEEFCILKQGAFVKRKDFEDKLRSEYPAQCATFRKKELTELICNQLEPLGVEYKQDRDKFWQYHNIGLLGDRQDDDFRGDPVPPDTPQPC